MVNISEVHIFKDKENYDQNFFGFANLVIGGCLIIKSIGIWKTGSTDNIRITFPTKGKNSIELFYPITKEFFNKMKSEILKKIDKEDLYV